MKKLTIRWLLIVACWMGCALTLPAVFALDAPLKKLLQFNSPVERSFYAWQRALRDGELEKVIDGVTPASKSLFESALKIARDPDSVDSERLSQMEVLLGFQARWLLGTQKSATITVSEFLSWSLDKGFGVMDSLGRVDLSHVAVSGACAVAEMSYDGKVITNATLSFENNGGRWCFDLRKVLLAGEERMDEFRRMRDIKKSEMAVFVLEAQSRQPIPELRELLLAPEVRLKVKQLKGQSPASVYDAVFRELNEGRQRDAEAILNVCVGVHTNAQRLAFIQAVCSRSRWDKDMAVIQFRHVLKMNPETLEGNCARYVLDLDEGKHTGENMNSLRYLMRKCPGDPFLAWIVAIECRDYFRKSGETTYSKIAEQCYRQILQCFKVGPVLLHQTFANVLSEELDKQEEALQHRRIAVAQEPAAWTYQGLANTLYTMHRYDEANKAYAKLLELEPTSALYWSDWARSLSYENRYDDSIEKCKKAIECDASFAEAYRRWGWCLEQKGNFAEAESLYMKSRALNPTDRYTLRGCVRIFERLGKNGEAMLLREQIDRTPVGRAVAVSSNLNSITRPVFLSGLKGTDLVTLSTYFGSPETNVVYSEEVTEYRYTSSRGKWRLALRMDQGDGLKELTIASRKDVHPTVTQWKTALWNDFGIKFDRIRINKGFPKSGKMVYVVECLDAAHAVKSVKMFLNVDAVIDPKGETFAALKEEGLIFVRIFVEL